MSTVHEANDLGAGGARVAVKLLDTKHPDRIKKELFKRETQALQRLSHPNIVRLVQSGWDESAGAFYLALEHLPYSLSEYLNERLTEPLGELDKYKVMSAIADALAHAHSEEVVHRDIKPSNILLDAKSQPYLTDFGISLSRAEQNCTAAPEQWWTTRGEGGVCVGGSGCYG